VNVDDSINEAMELGANAYVTKPFNLEDISNKVKNILNINS
jgi:DNA-binding response OmpR family regulator